MASGILIDLTRCTGCKACEAACRQINRLPAGDGDRLAANRWTVIERRAGLNVKRQCMHCLEPTCASVCPVGALTKQAAGPVTYDEKKCMGCRYCMVACPFEVPTYEWDKALPRMQKCIMCYSARVSQGEAPACVSVCPAKATTFGEREELAQTAFARIREYPGRYVDHVYGLREAGGTSVLYLSSIPFKDLGFPGNLAPAPYPQLTWKVLSRLPNIALTGGVLMFGIWWVISRRMEMAEGGRTTETDEFESVNEEPRP